MRRSRLSSPMTTEAVICKGCGAEIDPTTCGCGSEEEDSEHGYGSWENYTHPFIPMGCNCFRAKRSHEDLETSASGRAEKDSSSKA